jgi:nitroreductase
MHALEAIFNRRSIREYTGEPVDEATIRRLIEAAVHAPNADNAQPWAFTVVRDRHVLDRIAREAKAHMLATMPAVHADRFRGRLSDPAFDVVYRAKALVVISAKNEGPWIVEDCVLAAQNLMLAAFAEGLGTCFIGFAQSYLNTPAGKAAIGAPATWVPVAPIVVGWPAATPAPVPREPPEIRWLG